MHRYQAFGLHIHSALVFPELAGAPDKDTPDLVVELGQIPHNPIIDGTHNPFEQYNAQQYLLLIPQVARYYATNGNLVIIEPLCNDIDLIRLYFLGSTLAAILYQRNWIPLHASGILDRQGQVWLFTGDSGVGKSTLLYTLVQLGYQPFTDDVCILKPFDHTTDTWALASYPSMKQWDNTLNTFAHADQLRKQRLGLYDTKYRLDFHDAFVAAPRMLKAIITLGQDEQLNPFRCSKLSALDVFFRLNRDVYRPHLIRGMDKLKTHFALIQHLSNHIPTYACTRPALGNTIQAYATFIQQNLLEKTD